MPVMTWLLLLSLFRLGSHDAVIVLRMLLVVFSGNVIAVCTGITRECAIFLVNLGSGPTDLGVGTITFEVAIGSATLRPTVATIATTRTLVVDWSHIKVIFCFASRFAAVAPLDLP